MVYTHRYRRRATGHTAGMAAVLFGISHMTIVIPCVFSRAATRRRLGTGIHQDIRRYIRLNTIGERDGIGCPGDRGRGDSIGIADRTDSTGIVYSMDSR